MTPLTRWFRNLRERLFGSFYEGPEPPKRLEQMVVAFANTHPHATKKDWFDFTVAHARESYRAGWTRGFEYTERDPDERAIVSQANPNLVADALDPDWEWSPEIRLQGDINEEVPDEAPQGNITWGGTPDE